MHRFKNLVIGGIQSKVFNLILYTVLLLTAAFMAISLYQTNMLTKLAADSSRQQQEAIGSLTGQVMDAVVEQSLQRSNQTDAAIADAMFEQEAQRVVFLADVATKLFAHPEDYSPKPYSGPRAEDDGTWTAKVIYADGVNPEDPAIIAKLGLISNLSETIVSLGPSVGASAIYIGMPEGVHLTASDTSSSWLVDGKSKTRDYDPRQRGWYQAAVEKGGLVYYANEQDIDTGAFCVECAMPVYGPDGSLQAVIGTDLFLENMQGALQGLSLDGELFLLVNQNGLVIPGPQADAFPLDQAHHADDLRQSPYTLLAQVVTDALNGQGASVQVGEL